MSQSSALRNATDNLMIVALAVLGSLASSVE